MDRKFLNRIKIEQISLILLVAIFSMQCDQNNGVTDNDNIVDYSGIYCLNMQNLEMTIVQTGNTVIFTLQSDLLTNGTGTIAGNTLQLTAVSHDSATFTSVLTFSENAQSFSGPFTLTDTSGRTTSEGTLLGNKGECPEYDISANGIPEFVSTDFTQLMKIEQISKFRSGFGHSFTDDFEACRSMKHYYNPHEIHRKNNDVEIYSPVNGTIISVSNDGHGASLGLTNKQIQIRPDDQPSFTFVLFHVDLVSSNVETGKRVQSGEKLGYARLYYEDLGEYSTSFDIAVWVNTPSGQRLVSYFETLNDVVFQNYISRGALSRQDFIITQESRDAKPLECNGELFVNSENLENWVIFD